MNIRDTLLSSLFEQLAGGSPQPALNIKGFQIGEWDWSCLAMDSESETWFIRPLSEADRVHTPQTIQLAIKSNPLKLDEKRTNASRDSIQSIGNSQGIVFPSHGLTVLRSKSNLSLLVVKCGELQLVAELLSDWGHPPQSVALDWQNQLESLGKEVSSNQIKPSTAETLITKQGILLPLTSILKQLEGANKTEDLSPERPQSNLSVHHFTPAAEWPRAATVTTLEQVSNENRASLAFLTGETRGELRLPQLANSLRTKPSRKPRSRWPAMGVAAGIALSIGTTAYLLTANSISKQASSNLPFFGKDPLAANPVGSNVHSNPMENPTESNDTTLSFEPQTNSQDTYEARESGELTIDALIAQLQSKQGSSNNLATVTASSIIDEALAGINIMMPDAPTDQKRESNTDEVHHTEETELSTVLSEKGVILLERPMQIKAALTREFVSIGKPVIAKSCHCEIELKLTDKLIVEPLTELAIEGTGKQSWRIAIEDEEPELMVEIASKPGSRWQLMTSVGLKENAGAIPILIGPRDAQNVGNRLILFRQWVDNTIESLRIARANRQSRTSIDFTSEIKKLESQQREVNKAIDRWKLISRLTHLFFDENEVRIELHAVEKR